jgi:hypothetical protein
MEILKRIFSASDSAASIAASAASASAALVSANNASTSSMISTSDTATDNIAIPVAISVTFKNTKLVTTLTQLGTFTLANGVDGQIKKLVLFTKGGAVTAIVTPANLQGGTIITFTNVGDSIELLFLGTKWFPIGTSTAVVS